MGVFPFGMTTKGKSNVPVSSAQWFAFSTNLNAKSVKPRDKLIKEPEKATIEFNRYKANVVPVLVPNKEVTDGQKISMI